MAIVGVPRAAILGVYGVVFWLLLPSLLWRSGRALEARLGWQAPPRITWGAGLLLLGVALAAWSILELWRGGRGWPVSALPPTRFTRRGPYRHVRHPLYLGFNLAMLGMGLAAGAPGPTLTGGVLFAPVWILYALAEERALVRRFGEEYRRYRRQVGLLPRVGLYRLAQAVAYLGGFRVRVEGREHAPSRGGFVLVANHACYLDPCYVGVLTSRPVHFLATAECFRTAPRRWFFRRLLAVPVRRYRPDPAACRELVRLLEEGEVVGVFPEGERSPRGDFRGAMPEIARMLSRLEVPVVPVGISGSYDCGPRWSDKLRLRRVRVRAGSPIAWDGAEPARVLDAALRALIDADPQPVHLAGLPKEHLRRVLWRCPRCLDEPGWQAAELRCARCGAGYRTTASGELRDEKGATRSLAHLGRAVDAAGETGPLALPATARRERSPFGPIGPLVFAGEGVLRAGDDGLRFGEVFIPVGAVRSATVERADTLQVATTHEMWQFRLREGSAFRLRAAVEGWRVADRFVGDRSAGAAAKRLPGVPA